MNIFAWHFQAVEVSEFARMPLLDVYKLLAMEVAGILAIMYNKRKYNLLTKKNK